MITKNSLKRMAVLIVASLMLTSTFTACKSKNTSASSSAINSEAVSSDSSTAASAAESVAESAVSLNNAAANSIKSSSKSVSYTSKSYFNSTAAKKESKISINNSKIKAPPIVSSAPAASIVKRTQIEGIDGSFIDANVTESVRDLGGKTYKFGTFWPSLWTGGKTATADSQRCADALKTIEKDYNCKIQLVTLSLDTYVKNISASRASGKVYANVLEFLHDPIISSGNLADLRTVNSIGIKTNQWNPVQTLVTSYKSGVYGVGLRYDYVEHDILLFNKVLAQKYNLGDFYDMVNKGQWTDDRFLQVSQAFKSASGGNIMTCEGIFPQEILNLVYSNWTSPFGITDSKYIFNGTDSSVLDILNFCQNYVKLGLYDTKTDKTDFKTDGTFNSCLNDNAYSSPLFSNGKCLFYIGSDTMLPSFVKSCKQDYGLLPLPKGPASDDYTAVIRNAKFFSLVNGDPDIENDGALLTAIANRTNIKKADIISYNTTLVRDSQSVDVLTKNYEYKQILDIELCASDSLYQIYYGGALSAVLKQQATPKQAMDGIANKAQAEINTAFGQ